MGQDTGRRVWRVHKDPPYGAKADLKVCLY
jgi:hypothetical protein